MDGMGMGRTMTQWCIYNTVLRFSPWPPTFARSSKALRSSSRVIPANNPKSSPSPSHPSHTIKHQINIENFKQIQHLNLKIYPWHILWWYFGTPLNRPARDWYCECLFNDEELSLMMSWIIVNKYDIWWWCYMMMWIWGLQEISVKIGALHKTGI